MRRHGIQGIIWRFAIALSVCHLAPVAADDGVTIEVTGGAYSGLPISIVPFSISGGPAEAVQPADIIESNLRSSGRFEVIPREQHLSRPDSLDAVNYRDWRLIKSEALVIGDVVNIGNNRYEVRFRLIDVFSETQLVGQKFVVPTSKMRKAAHQISDVIYEKLTGRPGAFNTRIAFVDVRDGDAGQTYRLQVADSDGWDPKTILESTRPILSPTWSPDGDRMAYVSFEQNKAIIFVQDIWTGDREPLAEFKGLNSAPAWSPDGKKLALTLSKDGNPEVYVYDTDTGFTRRITRHPAIDTEPAWSPDGRTLIFSSGRAGGPQIYRVSADGGEPKRLTFEGSYNAGASFSPDGRQIVLITNQGNGYKVGLYSLNERRMKELTTTAQDESPSFSPNGDMVIYATAVGNRTMLATVAINGQAQQFLRHYGVVAREPAWSPIPRNR
ncbi:MAG: Tol-Pal system beta propeller repeat protein TolB [Gammaproteobacteria bacterium]|nr:Tol-Pal system beta propeller repeat protein TolB [Gammaproteobacteria bacterium]MYD75315.1 Tol-Pal system beta propeller repeat protein TolB [Gammaproteobacteria bacterium]MYJ51988.1 Tol-Pal system beta propeller repeat protein TolB [Gammaproteobacteria bacterium]